MLAKDSLQRRLRALAVYSAVGVSFAMPQWAEAQIPYEVIASSRTSGGNQPLRPTLVVIRSETDFEALWMDLGRRRGMPEVDFRRHTVIAYFLGGRPTSGYSVEVERVGILGGTMTVQVVEIAPGSCCVNGLISTYPDVMIATVPWKGQVEVEVRVERKSCCP